MISPFRSPGHSFRVLSAPALRREPDPGQRIRYINTAAKLLHNVAGEKGELPTMGEVDSGPVLTHVVEGVEPGRLGSASEDR
jgi:hypothetical protein